MRFLLHWSSVPIIMLQEAWAYEPTPEEFAAFAPTQKTLLSIYSEQLEKRSSSVFYDRLGPPSMLNWANVYVYGHYETHQLYINAGEGSMEKSLLYSFRETFTHLDMFGRIRDQSEHMNTLIVGTIGNTAESQTDPLSANPTAARDSFWHQMKVDGNFQYGFRPFDGDPYVYLSSKIGRWHNDAIAYTLLRCHYDPMHFKPRIDGLITVNTPFLSQFSAGTSFDPTIVGSSTSDLALTIGWSRMFGSNIRYGFASISTAISPSSQTYFLSYHIPW